MWRSLSVVLMGALCLVQFQFTSGSVSSTTLTSIAPTKSSSMSPMTSTINPSPTVTPLPPGVNNYTYVLNDVTSTKNKTVPCLRMQVDVALNFTYVNTTNYTKSIWIRFQNSTLNVTIDEESICNGTANKPFANLILKYFIEENTKPFYVNFSFNGDRTPGNQQWNFHRLSVNFTYDNKTFIDNKDNDKLKDGDMMFLYTNNSLFDDTFSRVELTRPYVCLANQTIRGFNVLGKNTTVGVWVRQLEVQAFSFTNPNGTFSGGNAPRVCLLDNTNTGNEVVPIAVGAALAVLVTIVLIAYLIGRVRNKKKSSYEALN